MTVFVAMDTRLLVKAIEATYEGRLPETLHPGGPGMEYLEKIIQIPFWVPPPRPDQVRSYATGLMATAAPPMAVTPAKPGLFGRLRQLWRRSQVETPAETRAPVAVSEPASAPDFFSSFSGVSPPPITPSADEMRLIEENASFFATTPRGIKRVVNLFRLSKTLYHGGVVEGFDFRADPEKVIRLIVLAERFPDFYESVIESISDPQGQQETFESVIESFVARERAAAEQLSRGLRGGKRAELYIMERLVTRSPALMAEDFRWLAPCIVNIALSRSWHAYMATADPSQAAGLATGAGSANGAAPAAQG